MVVTGNIKRLNSLDIEQIPIKTPEKTKILSMTATDIMNYEVCNPVPWS